MRNHVFNQLHLKKKHAKGHLDACLNKLGHEDVLESCVMLKKYLLEIFKIQISLLITVW